MTERAMQLTASDNQHKLAIRQQSGRSPGVLFLHGFRSDMAGGKADYVAARCAILGHTFTRFDLRGHGQSGGKYTDFTLSDWRADVLQVLDECTEGPQIFVGSSLGGWLMLLAAEARPERIAGLVGIAAAPDFTHRIMGSLSLDQLAEYEQTGQIVEPTTPEFGPNIFTRHLIEDGAQHCLINPSRLSYTGPVHLLQGMQDDAVPWQHALNIASALPGNNVKVTFFKDGGHRLAEPPQLLELGRAVEELLIGDVTLP